MTRRMLSHSEIDTALTCWAKWDFAYGGRLAGSCLKPKELAPILSEGRAWGAAVAAWHRASDRITAPWDAHEALRLSLAADADVMDEAGFPPDTLTAMDTIERLASMLDHYIATVDPIPGLERLEAEIEVGIPARSGTGRSSTRYRYLAYIDGFTDAEGGRWIVEFKLRGQLTDPALLELQRQPRWYAWAEERRTGRPIMGVIVDERLNAAPKAAKVVNARRKGEGINGKVPSHAKDQITTAQIYRDLCHEFGVPPQLETVEALDARQWHQRFDLSLRPDEIEEAGEELTAAAKLIRDLDSGELHPIRHASRRTCGSCRFKPICPNPNDDLYVETIFDRTEPKRLRELEGRRAA